MCGTVLEVGEEEEVFFLYRGCYLLKQRFRFTGRRKKLNLTSGLFEP